MFTAYDAYTVTLAPGPLLIDMRGADSGGGTLADPFLALYRGSFNPAAPCTNLAASNDDFDATRDAEITLASITGGMYVIVATAFDAPPSGLGTYTLTAMQGDTPVLNTTGALTGTDPTFNRPTSGSQSVQPAPPLGNQPALAPPAPPSKPPRPGR